MFLAMLAFITSLAHLSLVVMYSVAFTAPLMLTIGANLFLGEKVGGEDTQQLLLVLLVYNFS